MKAHELLARALEQQALGQFADAILSYRALLDFLPDNDAVFANLSGLMLTEGLPDDALRHGRNAVLLAPGQSEAWNNFANALLEFGDDQAAANAQTRAVSLAPESAIARINLSGLQLDLGRNSAGMALARLALSLAPDAAGAYNNLANGALMANELAMSIKLFRRGLIIAPDDSQMRFNLAAPLLKSGQCAEGWQAYEARRETPAALRRRSWADPLPHFRGGDISRQRLLISLEQGFGDGLQFCRYAPWLAERGARIVLRAPDALLRLMRRLPGVEEVISLSDRLPPFDAHLPAMSVPHFFPEALISAPYLTPDPSHAALWRARLAPLPGRKIGLVWSGDPRPGQRAAHFLDRRRSLDLAALAGFAYLTGITWISLQKGAGAAQLKAPPKGLVVQDWTAELTDFADSAALIAALDLVISVDTSVAHLAGALGKPVWLISRFDGCWRWGLQGDSTEWYSSMRLFRQKSPGDWRDPLEDIAKALALGVA